jgi:CDP-glycerol glycerophosphotransferase
MGVFRHKLRYRYRAINTVRYVIDFLFRLISRFIPKNDCLMVFHSTPDFCDNPRAFYEYIAEAHGEQYRCVWLVESEDWRNRLIDAGIPAEFLNSPKALWLFARAKYIITSHTYGVSLRVPGQIYVNLWHGMPLKAIGMLESSSTELARGLIHDRWYLSIATSQIMKSVLSASLGLVARRVMVTGQPRNDRLYCSPEVARECLERLIGKRLSGKRVVLYLPTYRVSDVRRDGVDILSNPFYAEPDIATELSNWLRSRSVEFIVKPHPHEIACLPARLPDGVSIIAEHSLRETLVDLYDILPAVDVLVTDYSSVYFDFLLLDRPIVFHVPDLEQYRADRGFAILPFEYWTPGPKTFVPQSLIAEIGSSLDDPSYFGSERRDVDAIVNEYRDSGSCERVYNAMIGRVQ